MNENNGWKILQVIPAQVRWKAVHCQESVDSGVAIFSRAIICWALVEATRDGQNVGQTRVCGIEQAANRLIVVEDLIKAEENGANGIDPNQYFLGYDDPEAHKESDFWIEQANDRLKVEKEKRSHRCSEAGSMIT